jgi:CRISPR-associated protein (TIGR03986 family)
MVKAIKRTDTSYVNPYNFVSIDKTTARTERKTGDLRGIIRCKLETLQPLIIPGEVTNPEQSGQNEHKIYTFFSYDRKTPVIPGSSLRGMLRSYFEAVTNSCMSTADNENVLYRRTGDNKTQYGIIEGDGNDGYVMYGAEKLMLNTSEFYKRPHVFGAYDATQNNNGQYSHRHKTGEEVWVKETGGKTYTTNRGFATGLRGVDDLKLKSTTTSCPAGYKEGVVLIGENYGTSRQGKHHDAVLVYTDQNPATRTKTGKPITPKDFERLRQVWGLYQPKGKVGKPGLPKGVNQKIKGAETYSGYLDAAKIPVYYSQIGEVHYLSPACIGKEVFSRAITELLKANGEHQPCNKRDHGKKVCPACALFGMVEQDNVISSRVQVRDAVQKAGQTELLLANNKTLPILSGPKITATEFYMEPYPNSEFFNYDYYKHSNGSEALIANPKLRGRKFYWHHYAEQTATPNRDQNSTFKPINKGKCFEFEIAFERLNDLELQQLLWVLSFGRYWQQPGSNNYAHKLGHGKPAGYGSVKIDVTEVKLFTIDSQTLQLKSEDGKPNDWNPGDSKSVQELLAMSDYVRAPDNVNYPVGKIPNKSHKNETGIYQWFTLNKGGVGKSKFTDVLPRATDANGNINPALALQGYEQYETENHEPDPQGNIEIVIETFPAVDKTVYSAQNAIHQSQSKPVPVNTIALQADVRRQRAKEDRIIKELAELSSEIGKPKMPVQKKADREKLSAYLQKKPRPDDASQKLAKAYDEAEAKLKQAK